METRELIRIPMTGSSSEGGESWAHPDPRLVASGGRVRSPACVGRRRRRNTPLAGPQDLPPRCGDCVQKAVISRMSAQPTKPYRVQRGRPRPGKAMPAASLGGLVTRWGCRTSGWKAWSVGS